MLTRADLEKYDRDGYIVVPDVLSADEVAVDRKSVV